MVGSTVNTIDVWWDGDADGVVNMGADECLAAEAQRRGGMLVRLYGWSKSTVSLGAFQKLSDALAIRAIRGMPIVRRPSGGGAIVHGSDLTYAAAVPKTHPWGSAPQLLYDALHGAMAEVLREDGIAATIYRAVIDSPSSQSEIENRGQSPEPFFCFERRSTGDLVGRTGDLVGRTGDLVGSANADPIKIMGSSQRRLEGAVLQHGSLLICHNPDFGEPVGSGQVRQQGLADLPGFSNDSFNRGHLERRWLQRVAASLSAIVREQPRSFLLEKELEIKSFTQRFREERWTNRR